jgi:hypothetical protein
VKPIALWSRPVVFCDQGVRAELARKHNQRAVEHAPLFQVADQFGDRFIDGSTQWSMRLHIVVSIPRAVAAARVADLDKAHAVLLPDGAPAAVAGRNRRLLCADPVQLFNVFGLGGKIDHGGFFQHHAGCEFKRSGTSGYFAFDRVIW